MATLPREHSHTLNVFSHPIKLSGIDNFMLSIDQHPQFNAFSDPGYAIQSGMLHFYQSNPEEAYAQLTTSHLATFTVIWDAVSQYNMAQLMFPGMFNSELLTQHVELELQAHFNSEQAAEALLLQHVNEPGILIFMRIYRRIMQTMRTLRLVHQIDCQTVIPIKQIQAILLYLLNLPPAVQHIPYILELSFFAHDSPQLGLTNVNVSVYIIWFRGQFLVQVGSYTSPVLTTLGEVRSILEHVFKHSKLRRDAVWPEEAYMPAVDAAIQPSFNELLTGVNLPPLTIEEVETHEDVD